MRKSILALYYTSKYIPWIFRVLPDSLYLKLVYRIRVQKKLNLKNPTRYNEKLQWLKLHDKQPQYTQMVDKYLVKNYVSATIGDKYVVPLLGVWDRAEDIDFNLLPNQFVLKCNHDSQGIVICRDKASLDYEKARKKLSDSLKHNFYYLNKEWPYKNVKRKIIAEQYLEDDSGELKDYKVLCFDGEPKLIEVHTGRFNKKHRQDIYDTEWNLTEIHQTKCGLPNAEKHTPKPEVLNEMLECSRILSKGIPHIRVDWYVVNGNLYFGELTFFDASGYDDFEPDEWNYTLGDWIKLKDRR